MAFTNARRRLPAVRPTANVHPILRHQPTGAPGRIDHLGAPTHRCAIHHGEPVAAVLLRLRLARGYSQQRLAELLCVAAAHPTLTRHDISRWERGKRAPGPFWRAWLAVVLDVPPQRLTGRLDPATAQSRLVPSAKP